MKCDCGGGTKVIDSRVQPDKILKRRRKCLVCGTRFTTIEVRSDVIRPEPNIKPKPVPKPKIITPSFRNTKTQLKNNTFARNRLEELNYVDDDSFDCISDIVGNRDSNAWRNE